MKKTLVLAVDRDDDYGVKAGIETPIIGIDKVKDALMRFGSVDPEDSDLNTLFAAVRVYDELMQDGRDVEVALICGDRKVGPKSDAAIVSELETVINEVHPSGVVLVGDGAEDEYVYPIISSRLPIDSVNKVYVKQAPSIEGTFYVMSKMITDADKRKRFLAPLGFILMMIAAIYLFAGLIAYVNTSELSYLYGLSTALVVMLIGVLFLLYAYNAIDFITENTASWVARVRSGNMTVTFTLLSFALIISGIIFGFYSVSAVIGNDIIYIAITFLSNSLWLVLFGVLMNDIGKVLSKYIDKRKVGKSFMIGTITFFGLGFVLQATFDMLTNYLDYGSVDSTSVIFEYIIGISFAVSAGILQASYKRYYRSIREEEADAVL